MLSLLYERQLHARQQLAISLGRVDKFDPVARGCDV